MISVIDMPAPEESMWWRGKRGFDVGFFPSECVRIIGDKVPAHLSLPGTTALSTVAVAAAAAAAAAGNGSGSSPSKHHHNTSGSIHSSSSLDNLPTKPVLRKHGKLISFFR